MNAFLNALKCFGKPFTNFVKRISKSMSDRKKLNIFQSTLKKASYAGSPFLKYYLGHRINNGLMFMLQTISFFTTLAGANYYLRGINGMAPILFAVTIQLGLFYYASSFTDMDGRKVPCFCTLSLFTVISIVFSYTGMAVVSFPPEQEYEVAYLDYCEKANTAKTMILESNSTQYDIELEINKFLASIENRLESAKNEITSLETAIQANDDIIKKSKITTTEKRENPTTGESTTISTTTYTEAGEQAQRDNAEKTTRKNNITLFKDNLTNAFQNVDSEILQKYVLDTLAENEKSSTSKNIYTLINYYNELNALLNVNQDIEVGFIDDLCKKYNKSETVSRIDIKSLEELLGDENTSTDASTDTFKDFIYKLLTQESSAASALKKLNTLKSAINDNYRQLEEQATIIGIDESVLSDVRLAKQEMDSFGDPNVQVLMYLADLKYRNRVLGISVLAILVDGLTFLLGVINRQRRLSLLDPSTNKELIDNEEQLFSIIFVSLVGSKMPDELKQSQKPDFKDACTQYVNNIKTIIHNFLSTFKNSPWTGQWGYGLYADYKELKKVEGAVTIISILHQLGYLQFMSYHDFQMLKDNFNGIDATPTLSTKKVTQRPADDEYICLLRYRVEMYLHHNTAEISTMFLNDEFKEEF